MARKMTLIAAAAGMALTFLPMLAVAQPRPNVFDGGNRWTVTCHNDASPAHTTQATQGICFFPYAAFGQGIAGIWYSDTFPNWNGRYYQEGDQVRMHGDYDQDAGQTDGHDGMEWSIMSARTGAGHWTEWRETPNPVGRTITYCNANWTRVGQCPNVPPLPGLPGHVEILKRLTAEVPPRCLANGERALDPLAPRQVACEKPE